METKKNNIDRIKKVHLRGRELLENKNEMNNIIAIIKKK